MVGWLQRKVDILEGIWMSSLFFFQAGVTDGQSGGRLLRLVCAPCCLCVLVLASAETSVVHLPCHTTPSTTTPCR